MKRGAAIAIVLAGACSGPAKPPPTEPDQPLGTDPVVDAGAAPDLGHAHAADQPVIAAERVWLKATEVSWPPARRGAQFHGLGGGTAWSVAIAVSADGSTPVGIARPKGGLDEAVRWQNGTMSPLETLDLPGDDRSTPYALSRDGSIVVGESTATHTAAVPVMWGVDGKAKRLALPVDWFSGEARAVSRDGSVIVGCGGGGCDTTLRWTAGGSKVTAWGPKPSFSLAAHALSEDGEVLAGNRGLDPAEAIRFSSAGVDSRGAGSHVEGISDDGAVMVGNIGTRAVLWRGKSAPVELGTVEGYDECYARAISADGGRVIGNCIRREPPASVAFVWDKRGGMRSVEDALAAAGVKLPAGWQLDEAFDICGYGVTIVGDGHSPSSDNEAWMVLLPR